MQLLACVHICLYVLFKKTTKKHVIPPACRCDERTTAGCEMGSGRCLCKPQFTGENCDRCADGYYYYPQCIRKFFSYHWIASIPGWMNEWAVGKHRGGCAVTVILVCKPYCSAWTTSVIAASKGSVKKEVSLNHRYERKLQFSCCIWWNDVFRSSVFKGAHS